MPGVVYLSELANWDGSLSVSSSSSQAGSSNTREPSAAPPSVSGSPPSGSRLPSASDITTQAATVTDSVSGASEPIYSQAFGSGAAPAVAATLEPKNGQREHDSLGSRMPEQDTRRSGGSGAPSKGTTDAAKKARQSVPPACPSPVFSPEHDAASASRTSPSSKSTLGLEMYQTPPRSSAHSAMSRTAQPSMPQHIYPAPHPSYAQWNAATAIHASTSASTSAHTQTTTTTPHSSAKSPQLLNYYPTLQSLLLAVSAGLPTRNAPVPPLSPPPPAVAPNTDPAIEDDLLDADGETDHESSSSVYALEIPRSAGSSRTNGKTMSGRGSTGSTTAISPSRAPSMDYHPKQHTEGSYSDEFLEAAQQYYVSPSPSVEIIDSPPPLKQSSAVMISTPPAVASASSSQMQQPQQPIAQSVGMQSPLDSSIHLISDQILGRRTRSLSPLSPLTSSLAVSSPASVRTKPAKRRRLNDVYVEVPPLPSRRAHAAYKHANNIPVLREGGVEDDYAIQLQRTLNEASMINAKLMGYTTPTSSPRAQRHLRRTRSTASASPTKQVPSASQVVASSSPVASRKRGRPPGSKNKPKPQPPSSGPPAEVEQHRPADNLEEFLPSAPVDIGELPVPSASLLSFAFRAIFPENVQQAGSEVASGGSSVKKTRTVARPSMPRRTPAQKATLPMADKSVEGARPSPEVQPATQSCLVEQERISSSREAAVDAPTADSTPEPLSSSTTSPAAHLQSPSASLAPPQSPYTPPRVSSSNPPTAEAPIPPPETIALASLARQPTATVVSYHGSETISPDMLATHGTPASSPGMSGPQRPRDGLPSPDLSRSPAGPTRIMNLSPGMLHGAPHSPGIMDFHHASHYDHVSGASGVADMFAAEKALRDVHNGYDASPSHDDAGLGESYFSPMDLEMGYNATSMDPTWLPDGEPPHPSVPANGTIDPSWLGGARPSEPELRPLTPSPPRHAFPTASPSTPHGADRRQASPGASSSHSQSSSSKTYSASGSHSRTQTATTPSVASDSDEDRPLPLKRKRTREQREERSGKVQLPIRLLCEEERGDAKRPRRLTERAMASYFEPEGTDDDVDVYESVRGTSTAEKTHRKGLGTGKGKGKASATGKGKGKGKSKSKSKAKSYDDDTIDFRALAEEPTFCHQCRNKNTRDKMRCTTIRESGEHCGLRFCYRCIENRYPEIEFNSYAVRFVCPRCTGTCNCTACCAKRGEVYISARVGKLPPAGSAEALALTAEAASAARAAAKAASPGRTKLDLVGGTYFGVVYGLAGERVGAGFVGKDSQGIVLGSNRAARRRTAKAVAYVGLPRTHRRPASTALVLGQASPAPNPNEESSAGQAASLQSGDRVDGLLNVPPPSGVAVDGPTNPSQPPSLPANPTYKDQPPVPALASVPPSRKMYVGDRAALKNTAYVPTSILFAAPAKTPEREAPPAEVAQDPDTSLEWAEPPYEASSADDDGDGGPLSDEQQSAFGSSPTQPPRDEVQWAIALALHAVEVSAVGS
ncbi:hypothetical protein C8Q77DRAFT_1077361 [Trametes polyzona]|nr:hypothetical protein C8Q77DRAFT_1077361 [Trametes polyzona]